MVSCVSYGQYYVFSCILRNLWCTISSMPGCHSRELQPIVIKYPSISPVLSKLLVLYKALLRPRRGLYALWILKEIVIKIAKV